MDVLQSIFPPFPTYIKGGEAQFRPGSRHFKRSFNVFDLLYVSQGEMFIQEEDQQYSVKEGEYLILAPEKLHFGYQVSSVTTHYFWIHFLFDNDYELIPQERLVADWSQLLIQEASFIEPARYYLQIPRYGEIRQRAYLENIFTRITELNRRQSIEEKLKQQSLFEEFILAMQKEAFRIPSAAEQVTQKVIDYIREHYNQGVKMEALAHSLLYHPDYVTRCMQQVTGLTPMQYLAQYRISLAKGLLATTNKKLATIALEVGIQDPTYFSKLFRKHEGLSPLEYRRIVGRESTP